MPYSSEHGKKLVDRALLRLHHEFPKTSPSGIARPFFTNNRVLDIGAGSGTYANLYSSNFLNRKSFTWDAVEIWEPYVEKFQLREKYNNVHVTDAISFFKGNQEFYDIIFMGDVVEHMTKEQAQELVKLAQQVSHLIIMSIPIVHYPQDEYEGNPYEAHVKDDWSTHEVLTSFDDIVSWGTEDEIGVFFIQGTSKHDLAKTLEPKIGVYAIAKNEKMFADRFMNSVIEADQVVVCDTGSSDGTYESLCQIAAGNTHVDTARFNAELIIQKISLQPFRFDDARNAAMSLLRPDIDVCVSIDFDEYMEDGWREVLKTEAEHDLHTRGFIVDRWNHRFMTIWNWKESDDGSVPATASEHWHERIHTRNNYLWKLPVHEVLVKVAGGPEEVKWLGGFMQIQKPDTTKSRSSYLSMLEKSVKEDPTRWKSWSFLAGDLFNAGRHDEAFQAIEKAKQCPGADEAYLCNHKSRLHQSIGQMYEALDEMSRAVMKAPHLREYKVYLARLYMTSGDYYNAQCYSSMAAAIKDRTYGYEYDESCWGQAFDELIEQIRNMK